MVYKSKQVNIRGLKVCRLYFLYGVKKNIAVFCVNNITLNFYK